MPRQPRTRYRASNLPSRVESSMTDASQITEHMLVVRSETDGLCRCSLQRPSSARAGGWPLLCARSARLRLPAMNSCGQSGRMSSRKIEQRPRHPRSCQQRRPHRPALPSCSGDEILLDLEGLFWRVEPGTRCLRDRLACRAAASSSGRFPLPFSIRRCTSSRN
jgi:hypothetical protein